MGRGRRGGIGSRSSREQAIGSNSAEVRPFSRSRLAGEGRRGKSNREKVEESVSYNCWRTEEQRTQQDKGRTGKRGDGEGEGGGEGEGRNDDEEGQRSRSLKRGAGGDKVEDKQQQGSRKQRGHPIPPAFIAFDACNLAISS
eukprot:745827-Hanusia_phi.AAC.4